VVPSLCSLAESPSKYRNKLNFTNVLKAALHILSKLTDFFPQIIERITDLLTTVWCCVRSFVPLFYCSLINWK
jgi:hypothetical protein